MSRLTGWLVVNSFLNTKKFEELYSLLIEGGRKTDIRLELKKTSDISVSAPCGKTELPDFILWWDKDINLARLYEQLGVRLYNSQRAIELCDNKAKTVLELSKNPDICLPKTMFAPKTFSGIGYTDLSFLDIAEEELSYPMIIKEAYGSFGAQVYLANNRREAEDIIKNKIVDREFIMQEFIKESRGRDVRINVVNKKAVASMMRRNDNDFRSNITNGGITVPYVPSAEQIEAAVSAANTLGLDFAGVDVLFGKDGAPYICEVNSNPHFKSTLDCTGINLADIILDKIYKDLTT